MPATAKLLILAHEGTWERRFQVSSLAASESAVDRPVDIALFFDALRVWVGDAWDHHQPSAVVDSERLERLAFPPLGTLLAEGRERGLVRVYACSASARFLSLDNQEVQSRVDAILGWQSFARMIRDAHRVVTL